MRERAEPHGGRRRREEVREDEDEAPARQRRAPPPELLEPERDAALRRVERRAALPFGDQPGLLTAPGRQPVRPTAGEVECGDVAAGEERARDDRVGGLREGGRLVQPGERRVVEGHARPSVAEDRDAWRLVGGAVAHDELVRARGCREAGARIPVDRRDRVARLVGPRADHVRPLAPPPARKLAERQAGELPPRNERKRLPLTRHVTSSSASGAARARGSAA